MIEVGTRGVTGPWIASRDAVRCQLEKVPRVVIPCISTRRLARTTSSGPIVAAFGGTEATSPEAPKDPWREFWAIVSG